ncbi:MAG: Maf family nucleotide pyrophosphatase [Prolixibacteraceae bacterium]
MLENLNKFHVVLASKSPRRQQLLAELGIQFEVELIEVEEVFPNNLPINEVPEYLAKLKAQAFQNQLSENDLIITSDTIVTINNEVLGKPANYNEGFEMLMKLSGKGHQVATGVYLLSKNKQVAFTSITDVFFKTLTSEEIDYYLTKYQPYDKAGAYGIQEWIGHIGVERIVGSYFNVMGLPIQRLYSELCLF